MVALVSLEACSIMNVNIRCRYVVNLLGWYYLEICFKSSCLE